MSTIKGAVRETLLLPPTPTPNPNPNQVRETFDYLDTDKSGSIDASELGARYIPDVAEI